MKTLTIGRNPECNIVYNDNMVSRRHALLLIYPGGRYKIVNQGQNGTTVNGNPVTSNQGYPLKRGDIVIFAGHCKLDWSLVPDPMKPYKVGGIVAIAVAVIVGAIALFGNNNGSNFDPYTDPGYETPDPAPTPTPKPAPQPNDTVDPDKILKDFMERFGQKPQQRDEDKNKVKPPRKKPENDQDTIQNIPMN